MKSPMAAVIVYEEDGIYFRVYNVRHRIKIYARLGKKAVIEHGRTPDEAAEKAKRRLITQQI
jgi:hypothetical protein